MADHDSLTTKGCNLDDNPKVRLEDTWKFRALQVATKGLACLIPPDNRLIIGFVYHTV